MALKSNITATQRDTRTWRGYVRFADRSVGGIAALSERTGLSRETLYRTLSHRGNPRLDTLSALLHAMGLRLSVTSIKVAA